MCVSVVNQVGEWAISGAFIVSLCESVNVLRVRYTQN